LEIARALARDPAFLILDEAVDGLEPRLEARIRENLRRRGLGVVVVSHRASTLAGCGRVVRIERGRVVAAPPRSTLHGEHERPPAPPLARGGDADLVAALRIVAAAAGEPIALEAGGPLPPGRAAV